ncbi:MAG TPA: L,D-transpeptidase [Mycobacteriales bacterium]|nr:L,D-transpeptidase [Mycobacteriales bacterium]
MPALTRDGCRALLALLCAAVLTGCSDARPPTAASTPSATTSPTASASSGEVPLAPGERLVATAVVDVVAVFADAGSATPTRRLDRREQTSGELVFLVEEQRDDRLRVQLPVRPNGSTGWVRTADVALTVTDFAVEVRLSDHELIVRKAGDEVLRAPIGVGTAATPTPGGSYYLEELLQPPAPGRTAPTPTGCPASPTSSPRSPAARPSSASTAPTGPTWSVRTSAAAASA